MIYMQPQGIYPTAVVVLIGLVKTLDDMAYGPGGLLEQQFELAEIPSDNRPSLNAGNTLSSPVRIALNAEIYDTRPRLPELQLQGHKIDLETTYV